MAAESRRIWAISGRVNSTGGVSPFLSICRTLVPLRMRWWELSWGHVRLVAIP